MTRRAATVIAIAMLAGATVWWRGWSSGEEREIRSTLAALTDRFNESADGAASLARAAQIGGYFTPDVVVDLGPGSAPIQGRDTLVGMAARLQPRTAAFRVELDDIGVELSPSRNSADVTLTVLFVRRSRATDEESSDAREFVLQMSRTAGRWQIQKATTVDTFR